MKLNLKSDNYVFYVLGIVGNCFAIFLELKQLLS